MPLKFTITDYTTNPAGVSTVVNEPVGWDSTTLRLKRDKTWHGFFDFFDDSYKSMQWHGAAFDILKNAYSQYGVEALCELKVEFACAGTATYETVYTGRFAFSSYSVVCADYCYVECGVENNNCVMSFRNRYDQKVNLDSLATFDAQCYDGTITVSGVFNNDLLPARIQLTGITGHTFNQVNGLVQGSTFSVAGTTNNNGTYTVKSVQLKGDYSALTIFVEGPLTNETTTSFTITGCLFLNNLTPYTNLNRTVELPTKPVRNEAHWGMTLPAQMVYIDDACGPVEYFRPKFYGLAFNWDIIKVDELYDTNPNRTPDTSVNVQTENTTPARSDLWRLANTGIFTFNNEGHLYCTNKVRVRLTLKGTISMPIEESVLNGHIGIQLHYGNAMVPTDTIMLQFLGALSFGNNDFVIDIPDFDQELDLNNGDSIWLAIMITNYTLTSGNPGGCPNAFTLTVNITEASLRMTVDSFCESSPANVYLLNETLSRITESYTNDCLRVKSNYFGRTDSQPYANTAPLGDGCGGMECITNGLKIRAGDLGTIIVSDDNIIPNVTVSMKQMFESLNAIHNIGMGIETDTDRGTGYECVRIEPVQHFYNNDILLQCPFVREVKTLLNEEHIYSLVHTGYQKWETEQTNGLNDVFGRREYRTQIKTVQQEYNRQSAFIASDYAIEATRRNYSLTTKDWRYDNDTFIVCLTRQKPCRHDLAQYYAPNQIVYPGNFASYLSVGTAISIEGSLLNNQATTVVSFNYNSTLNVTTVIVSGTIVNENNCYENGYFVEVGAVESATGIIYPNYCYNLRISPARNTIRHLTTLFQCYSNYQNGKLLFSSGDGNFLAQTSLVNDNCLAETGILAENQQLLPSYLKQPETAYPFTRPEKVTFDYPVTWQQYLAIKQNPYGLIGYQCGNGPMQYGWIDDFQLKPYTGLGQFTLRPKIES